MPVFNANSVDPDQTPRFAASDLVYTVSPKSFLWNARLKSVKTELCSKKSWMQQTTEKLVSVDPILRFNTKMAGCGIYRSVSKRLF